jgi:hypothetical protein
LAAHGLPVQRRGYILPPWRRQENVSFRGARFSLRKDDPRDIAPIACQNPQKKRFIDKLARVCFKLAPVVLQPVVLNPLAGPTNNAH